MDYRELINESKNLFEQENDIEVRLPKDPLELLVFGMSYLYRNDKMVDEYESGKTLVKDVFRRLESSTSQTELDLKKRTNELYNQFFGGKELSEIDSEVRSNYNNFVGELDAQVVQSLWKMRDKSSDFKILDKMKIKNSNTRRKMEIFIREIKDVFYNEYPFKNVTRTETDLQHPTLEEDPNEWAIAQKKAIYNRLCLLWIFSKLGIAIGNPRLGTNREQANKYLPKSWAKKGKITNTKYNTQTGLFNNPKMVKDIINRAIGEIVELDIGQADLNDSVKYFNSLTEDERFDLVQYMDEDTYTEYFNLLNEDQLNRFIDYAETQKFLIESEKYFYDESALTGQADPKSNFAKVSGNWTKSIASAKNQRNAQINSLADMGNNTGSKVSGLAKGIAKAGANMAKGVGKVGANVAKGAGKVGLNVAKGAGKVGLNMAKGISKALFNKVMSTIPNNLKTLFKRYSAKVQSFPPEVLNYVSILSKVWGSKSFVPERLNAALSSKDMGKVVDFFEWAEKNSDKLTKNIMKSIEYMMYAIQSGEGADAGMLKSLATNYPKLTTATKLTGGALKLGGKLGGKAVRGVARKLFK